MPGFRLIRSRSRSVLVLVAWWCVFAKVNPNDIELIDGFTRDVSKIGHFGTGDLEIALRSLDDLERAKPLIVASYEAS